ncbi:MAG: hypothetical protein A3J54_01420 [Candidatus Ryanbacteria bacterium RIFCSPHIGHO2_02_FULL_45_13b]|uniref:Uncharacterized protein n=1 Tax=Candidatus Ryanbacteria bacterium RIFCSPHIGHO2_02_FULL_45_13b TaxID=1802117 RepID=A0A1G2GAK6_9BACT|nr:MAG: hypothetical protein A3J54_01420 [Candidatus Ryanbacteria bacterium RIFCSPHIGHO2_02_FULL_45_13b]
MDKELMFDVGQANEIKSEGDMFASILPVLRGFGEVIQTNVITRRVRVNRSRTPQEVLEATGRAQYTDRKVVDAMPKGEEGDEVEVVFFKPDLSERNGYISDDDLKKEFELRGLKPADPISLAAVNEADRAFADEHPNATHWKDADGRWCYAAFNRWFGERKVRVRRGGGGWDDSWWFAGVRK